MDYLIYVILAPFAAGLLVVLILTTWKYRQQPAARALLWCSGAVAGLLITNAAELVAATETATYALAAIQHLFFSAVPIAWYAFAKRYAIHGVANRSAEIRWFIGIAVGFNLLIQSNHFHGLFYTDLTFFRAGGFLSMSATYGPLFWFYSAFSYSLLLAGLWYVIRVTFGRTRLYSAQAKWVLAGALFPVVFNVAYVFRMFPFLRKDYTPLSLAVSAGAFFVGIHWFRLFEGVPLARDVVFNDFKAALIVVDSDRRIVDFNPVAQRLFGLDDSTLGARAEQVPRVRDLLPDGVIEERKRESLAVTWEEQPMDLEVQVVPIDSGKAVPKGALITAYDVTSYVELARERDRALRELRRAMEHQREMQLQLYQQEKLASLGQMAANVAHEIHNPLAFIHSNVMALRTYLTRIGSTDTTGETEKLREEVELAISDSEDGIERIRSVTSSLLSLARPSGPEPEECNINEVVERAMAVVRPQLRRVAAARTDLGQVASIRCFPTEIAQVVINIVVNAVQAIEEAGRPADQELITIRTYETPDSVCCSITNTGTAIAEDLQDRIFEPFFTTKDNNEGTGLGLSLSKQIVENRHGGRLTLAECSPPSFLIELPKFPATNDS